MSTRIYNYIGKKVIIHCASRLRTAIPPIDAPIAMVTYEQASSGHINHWNFRVWDYDDNHMALRQALATMELRGMELLTAWAQQDSSLDAMIQEAQDGGFWEAWAAKVCLDTEIRVAVTGMKAYVDAGGLGVAAGSVIAAVVHVAKDLM